MDKLYWPTKLIIIFKMRYLKVHVKMPDIQQVVNTDYKCNVIFYSFHEEQDKYIFKIKPTGIDFMII